MTDALFDDDNEPWWANSDGLARNDHPDTSHEAASKVKNTGLLRRKVFLFILEQGERGATDEEIIDRFSRAGYTPNGIRPRRVELVRAEFVVDSGARRPTRSGRSAIVWREVAPAILEGVR